VEHEDTRFDDPQDPRSLDTHFFKTLLLKPWTPTVLLEILCETLDTHIF